MKIRFVIPCLAAVALAAGCATNRPETRVKVEELSPPARATVERVTAGGSVDQIAKEVEHGRNVYDVEATVGGKHLEFLIGDSDGAVLGTEVPVEWSDLPEPVRTAAEKFFGGANGLTAAKGVEFGETYYEVQGMKDGKKDEVSLTPDGKTTE